MFGEKSQAPKNITSKPLKATNDKYYDEEEDDPNNYLHQKLNKYKSE